LRAIATIVAGGVCVDVKDRGIDCRLIYGGQSSVLPSHPWYCDDAERDEARMTPEIHNQHIRKGNPHQIREIAILRLLYMEERELFGRWYHGLTICAYAPQPTVATTIVMPLIEVAEIRAWSIRLWYLALKNFQEARCCIELKWREQKTRP